MTTTTTKAADDRPASSAPPSMRQPQHEEAKPSTSPLNSFLAGFAGGSASTILLYPLDLIKVRMQVDERRRNSFLGNKEVVVGGASRSAVARSSIAPSVTDAAATATATKAADKPRTICTTVRGVIRHEGYLGLYRGLAPAIIGSAASWGGFFILYEQIKTKMLSKKRADATTNAKYETQEARLGPTEHFTASCAAGACMVGLTNPIWLIKTRLQLQNSHLQEKLTSSRPPSAREEAKPPYRGLLHAARTIVREEGVLALYKGSVPALMLVSHGGIQFVTYEFLKGHFSNFMNNDRKGDSRWKVGDGRNKGSIRERLHNSLGYLVMGASSKFVASTTTYPLQVMKARLQQRSQVVELSETTGEIIVSKREYSGVSDCVGKIWRNEGASGFFKGCLTNAIRVAPSAAITFVTYEFVLDTLTENR